MIRMMQKANQTIPRERLWVNPDCGLKTRHWDEVIPKRPFFVSQTDLLAVLFHAKAVDTEINLKVLEVLRVL